MDVLMVGSIAYDSVSSPAGKVEDALGGSAVYAGIASRFHANYLNLSQIGLVGVVGKDFLQSDIAMLESQGLDLSGLEIAEGKTFRWEGSYHGDMGVAETHDTHLNVFGDFNPKVPDSSTEPTVLFCANLVPALQAQVLEQAQGTRLSMLDSMNLWIEIAREDLLSVMKSVDLIIINDGEVKMLAGDDNLVRAAKTLISMVGCKSLVIKKGEHGVIAFHQGGMIALPAYPTELVVDPTGCGDSFAGTIAAYLASGSGDVSKDELREALVRATVTASFTLESFGTGGLLSLNNDAFAERLAHFREIVG
ncbi:MAG TPA: sugar kinase [Candidatus Poseidoniales archaeon]|nr:MAG TPA: sugar kinase [Candidatus Poseidoniales archaeon]HII58505.1 sugar kinase [Candidatus Poseidoniaceae archaeon]|tara:strand:+ start:5716 stop:6636 length:921 start_codon:yes stop_codon:yes gene_type:complete